MFFHKYMALYQNLIDLVARKKICKMYAKEVKYAYN